MVVSPPTSSSGSSPQESTTPEQSDASPDMVIPSAATGGLPGGDMNFRSGSQSAAPMLALPASSSSTATEQETETNMIPLDESGHKYVGLVNQAMTCYLNSLVQTLYMTPEFRNAIYRWEYKSQSGKGGSESSIPCQIQKLFLMLQTTDRDSLETTDLTASFGWTSNEAYDQHDVQELCRLMFDALEHRWKGSKHDKLIQNLYRGTMQDFVKCLTCSKENVRTDYFLDLPLALKPFGAHEAYRSVEEALYAFIMPEKLEGGNQYNCENCNAKRDAHKGLRITQFPYLLTIQLKRFDFDYTTMHRIKLNDKMTFPDVLNLNPFIYDSDNPDKENNMDSAEVIYNRTPTVGTSLHQDEIARLLKQGPNVYELFSIMVHQGSAAGGHYYAYIKNMDQDKWYCFNDTKVAFASTAEIEKSYGGIYGGWNNSNTNAYMLMYRKIRDNKNQKFIHIDQLPPHIKQMQDYLTRIEEDKQKQREYQASLVYITVMLNLPCDVEDLNKEPFKVEVPRTAPLKEVVELAWKYYSDKANQYHIQLHKNKGRFILLDGQKRMIQQFISKTNYATKLETLLNRVNYNKEFVFFYDFPLTPEGFRFVIPSSYPIKTVSVFRIDIAARTVSPPFYIAVGKDTEAAIRVKQIIGNTLGDTQQNTVSSRLVLQTGDQHSYKYRLLDTATMSFLEIVDKECYSDVPKVYYDGGVGQPPAVLVHDRQKPPEESEMFRILDRRRFAATLCIRLPNDEDIARATIYCNSVAGPSWQEAVTSIMTVPQGQLNPSEAEENISGRSTPCSLTDDAMLGSDSLCNPTPAVSPAVSETDEGYEERSNLSQSRSMGVWNLNTPIEYEEMQIDYSLENREYQDSIPSVASVAGSSSTLVTNTADYSQSVIIIGKSEHNVLTIDADNRNKINELKLWLSKYLKIDPSQFYLTIHYQQDFSDRGFEYSGKDDEQLANALNNNSCIDVKLRPPMKQDERLVKIILFDAEDFNKDNWKYLFDIPASKSTLIGDFLLQCLRLYNDLFQTDLTYQRIRLRDMGSHQRAILNPEQTFEQRNPLSWHISPLYFQVIEEALVGKKGEPIFVRRFRPSTVESGPIQEIICDTSSNILHWDLLKQGISDYNGIPKEYVEIADPPISNWDYGKWPFSKPRLELLEGQIKFHITTPDSYISPFISKIGNRVVYYKDSREESKKLTDDERKQITIKDNSVSSTAVQRRKERPLRIQMSSVSEA